MSNHTPGDWHVIEPSFANPSRAMVCSASHVSIYDAPLTNETAANARLIAAAPDLLRECRAAVAVLRDFANCYGQCGIDDAAAMQRQLEAAIAKAEGRADA
jgi:hypothetical protein